MMFPVRILILQLMVLPALLAGCSGDSSGTAPAPVVLTPYTVSGVVHYQDVEYAEFGWTGKKVYKPVRNAVVDLLAADNTVSATVTTDSAGYFLFSAVALAAAPAKVRVLAMSDPSGITDVVVRNASGGAVYSVGYSLAGLDLATPLNIDISQASGMGGVFNMLDVYQSALEYVASQVSVPVLPPLNVYWKNSFGSYTCDSTVPTYCPLGGGIYVLNSLGDQDEYDDDVLWHEFAHFIEYAIDATDSPGGAHTFTSNTLDLRLAWSEGHADYLQMALKRWLRATHPERLSIPIAFAETWYVDTDATGDFLIRLDMANPDTSLCGTGDCYIYSSNEIAIAKTLWTSSGDFSDNAIWGSFTGHLPTVNYSQRNLEPFWDGLLMQPGVTETAAKTRFVEQQINYEVDGHEPDNTIGMRGIVDCTAAATSCLIERHTLYNGAMVADIDIVPITVTNGHIYTISTSALTNGADTYLELLDSDGATVLAANDDVVNCGDPGLPQCSNNGSWFASRVVYNAAVTSDATRYVRVTSVPYASRWIGAGSYGGYSLTVTAN